MQDVTEKAFKIYWTILRHVPSATKIWCFGNILRGNFKTLVEIMSAKKSAVWAFFTLTEDKTRTKCTICQETLSFKGLLANGAFRPCFIRGIWSSSACSIGIPYTKYNTFYWPHCSDSTQAPPPEIWLVVPIFPRLDWHHPHHLSMTRACPAAICFDLISALEPPEIDTTDDR